MANFAETPNKFKETQLSLEKFSKKDKSYEVYFVLPNGGCEDCITTAENFVVTNAAKYPNILFIFTSISSVKVLKGKIPAQILNLPNVVIDKENMFIFPQGKKSIYPLVIYTEAGKIKNIEFQSPDQDAIASLVKNLNSLNANHPVPVSH